MQCWRSCFGSVNFNSHHCSWIDCERWKRFLLSHFYYLLSVIKVGFALDQAIYHAGTLNVYLSKAPSTAASYDGSGAWFKIYQITPVTNGGSSITFPTDSESCILTGESDASYHIRPLDLSQVTFKIPATTPPGEYLLRGSLLRSYLNRMTKAIRI